jgi:DNA-binding MarR family transcriptional regulator
MNATCACFNVRKAARAVTQLYDEILRPSGLRTTQFTLLMLLRGHGALRMSDLADRAMTDRTTLTRNLAVLRQGRLVRVRPGEDARVRAVELTEKGEDAVDAAFPLWEQAQASLTRGLGRDGLTRLLAELSAVTQATTKSPS